MDFFSEYSIDLTINYASSYVLVQVTSVLNCPRVIVSDCKNATIGSCLKKRFDRRSNNPRESLDCEFETLSLLFRSSSSNSDCVVFLHGIYKKTGNISLFVHAITSQVEHFCYLKIYPSGAFFAFPSDISVVHIRFCRMIQHLLRSLK